MQVTSFDLTDLLKVKSEPSNKVVCTYIWTLEKKGIPTLESGIDVGQGISVGPGKFVKNIKYRALNGNEQNVQIYVTKPPANLKISVDPGKNSKI